MNDKYALAVSYYIYGYNVISETLEEENLNFFNNHNTDFILSQMIINEGKIVHNDNEKLIYLWKNLDIENLKIFSCNLIKKFNEKHEKINIEGYPNVSLFVGISSESHRNINQNKDYVFNLLSNVDLLSENCVSYGVKNLLTEELILEESKYREIDKRILFGKNVPINIYSLLE